MQTEKFPKAIDLIFYNPRQIHHPTSGQAPVTQLRISAWSEYHCKTIQAGLSKLNCSTVAEAQAFPQEHKTQAAKEQLKNGISPGTREVLRT